MSERKRQRKGKEEETVKEIWNSQSKDQSKSKRTLLTSFWCSAEQKNIHCTPPFAQLEQRVDDSFPQTTHSPRGAVDLEVDMLRGGRVTGVETEPIERGRLRK